MMVLCKGGVKTAGSGGQGHRPNRRKAWLWLVDGLLLLALGVAVWKLAGYARSYRESAAQYADIRQAALIMPSPIPSSSAAPEATPAATPETPIAVDWEALQNRNKEIVAWLYCEDTVINYPVTQCDDNEYYLNRNADREEDEAGALFFDCRNNLFSPAENLIIYGHRRYDLSMFGSLARYAEEDYYRQHPVMYLLTPQQNYRVEIFACRTVEGASRYFQTQFEDDDAQQTYIRRAILRSYWQTDIATDADCAILTLATCSSYDGADSPRLLIHGLLVPLA